MYTAHRRMEISSILSAKWHMAMRELAWELDVSRRTIMNDIKKYLKSRKLENSLLKEGASIHLPIAGALGPAGGFLLRSNHHRGCYTSPAMVAASYSFVDLPSEITLYYKLLLFNKFSEIRLYFFNGIAYNGAGDKSELEDKIMGLFFKKRKIRKEMR